MLKNQQRQVAHGLVGHRLLPPNPILVVGRNPDRGTEQPNRNNDTVRPAACPRFPIGVTPYQQLPNPHSEVGLDCHRQTACGVSLDSAVRTSRSFFLQPTNSGHGGTSACESLGILAAGTTHPRPACLGAGRSKRNPEFHHSLWGWHDSPLAPIHCRPCSVARQSDHWGLSCQVMPNCRINSKCSTSAVSRGVSRGRN